MSEIKINDMVALLEEIRTNQFMTDKILILQRGQVGTVVEEYKDGEAYEVEFSDEKGQTYGLVTVKKEKLILLHYQKKELSLAG